MDNEIFLLGGYDLEMKYIKKILDDLGLTYYDKNLTWGAKLSSYEDIFSFCKDKIVYGIELIKDIKIECVEYVDIDHHNENSSKKSSLEQICEILNIAMTREQILVAANDKGYIPQMSLEGATEEEIMSIRKADRQAQGITEEDEKIAQEDLLEIEDFNGLSIVKTRLSKFSPITDFLYPKTNILVYNKDSFTYYGKEAKELGKNLKKSNNKIYYGGVEPGFMGASDLESNKINEIIGVIKNVYRNII